MGETKQGQGVEKTQKFYTHARIHATVHDIEDIYIERAHGLKSTGRQAQMVIFRLADGTTMELTLFYADGVKGILKGRGERR